MESFWSKDDLGRLTLGTEEGAGTLAGERFVEEKKQSVRAAIVFKPRLFFILGSK